ncbi:cytochrome c [Euzebya sp.]|uniref:c-type cytochrome n=1 Tax=Euzebya sp. TaxID=1971409 RepID=UPI0035136AE3
MRSRTPALTVLALALVVLAGCGGGGAEPAADAPNPVLAGTGDVAAGEDQYARSCAVCHGEDASGTARGPSFLSDIYVPSHHADAAFLSAVRNGVPAHHWDFGPMPPVPSLSDADVADIVAWVRAQQREAGLIE